MRSRSTKAAAEGVSAIENAERKAQENTMDGNFIALGMALGAAMRRP